MIENPAPEKPILPIAADLAAALQRLHDTGKRRIATEPPCGPTARQTDEILAERGFPARHRKQLLAGMAGPSLEKATELLPRILAGDCLLLLLGERGPGKTQMATWWGAQLIAEKFRLKPEDFKPHTAGQWSGIYRKTADVISEIKSTWHDGGKTVGTEDDLLKKYKSVKYLVLDEFHEKGSSDWEARTLVNMLDHRYDAMLVTVLIANMGEKQVREQVNPSIVSRAQETGGLVLCDWASYRTSPEEYQV